MHRRIVDLKRYCRAGKGIEYCDLRPQSRYPRIQPNKIPTDPIIADSMMNIRRTEYSRMPSDFMIAMSWRFSWVMVEMIL